MSKVNPKTLDKLFELKQEIEADEAKLKKKKDKYNEGKGKLIEKFTKIELASMKTSKVQVSIIKTVVPIVEDWSKFFKSVVRNKSSDLLRKGVATAAWRERIEAGKKVPGVGKFTKITLRLAKVK